MSIIIFVLAILFSTTSPALAAVPEIPPGITPILTIGIIGLAIVIKNKFKK